MLYCYFQESKGLDATSILNKEDDAKDSDESDDISSALKKEISELKAEHELPLSSRRFQACFDVTKYSLLY